jgi:hypothetical protein
MKKAPLLILLMALISMTLLSQTNSKTEQAKAPAPMPQIRQNGVVKQMFVDGKPFIMLAGELHGGTAIQPIPIYG